MTDDVSPDRGGSRDSQTPARAESTPTADTPLASNSADGPAAPTSDAQAPADSAGEDTDLSWSASDVGDAHPEAAEAPRREGRRRSARRRGLRTVAVVVLVIIVPLALLAFGGLWAYWQIDPPGSPGEPIAITLEEGWGVKEIADHLDDEGVVGSSLAFQIYARATGSDEFQAGNYELAERMGVREAVQTIEAGPIIDYVDLPVIPGLWITEVAQRVNTLPDRSGEAFLEAATSGTVRSPYQPDGVDTLEGLLWPDTYRVSDGEDEEAVLRSMLALFEQHAAEAGLEEATVEGLDPYKILTVASIVQQEAKVDADRPLIASVIYNRLRDGTPLQIDATVLYCIGERKSSNTEEDRATDCPHNTYLHVGLPPTPIGSVTEASLDAALHPAATPYRFYVLADADGSHVFAETFEEHTQNVDRARELGLLG